MEDFKVTQTGDEIQEILNQSPLDTANIAELEERLSDVEGKIPSEASDENQLADKKYVDDSISDTADELTALINSKANSTDVYTKSETYNKTELDSMITTPDVQYVSVTATAQTAAVTDVLPATGAADTVYRVGSWDGTQYDANSYSEYAWNGTAYVPLSVKDAGIATGSDFDNPTAAQRELLTTVGAVLDGCDAVPTEGSVKPVQSGGAFSMLVKLVGFGTDGNHAGVTQVGQAYFNTSTKLIRYAKTSTSSSGYITLPFLSGAIYTCNNKFYIYNGDTLIECPMQDSTPTANSDKPITSGAVYNLLIKLTGFGTDAQSGGITAVGQTYFNTSSKLLRCALTSTAASGFVTLPFLDGAIYTCNNELYIYNGTTLVVATAEIKEQISEINDEIDSINSVLETGYKIIGEYSQSQCTLSGTAIKATTGESTSFSNWKRYNDDDGGYIDIGDATKIKLTVGNSATSFGLAFYSAKSEASYISGIIYQEQSNVEYDVPENAMYFRYCCFGSVSVKITLIASGVEAIVQQSAEETVKVITTNDTFDFPVMAKHSVYIPNNGTILLTGASFAESANGWFEIACTKLGLTGINKAVGGTSVMDTANGLYNGTLFTDAQFEQMDVLVIFHAHNKNVYNGGELEQDYDDYTLPFDTSVKTDANYCRAFDYVIKKYRAMCYDQRNNQDSQWYGTAHGKPCQIVLCTHWHDARVTYNNAVRKLAIKWGFPLVTFDENIGFTRFCPYSNGVQISRWYATHGLQAASQTETIDGVVYGWHPDRGQDQFIQKRMADIFCMTVK